MNGPRSENSPTPIGSAIPRGTQIVDDRRQRAGERARPSGPGFRDRMADSSRSGWLVMGRPIPAAISNRIRQETRNRRARDVADSRRSASVVVGPLLVVADLRAASALAMPKRAADRIVGMSSTSLDEIAVDIVSGAHRLAFELNALFRERTVASAMRPLAGRQRAARIASQRLARTSSIAIA